MILIMKSRMQEGYEVWDYIDLYTIQIVLPAVSSNNQPKSEHPKNQPSLVQLTKKQCIYEAKPISAKEGRKGMCYMIKKMNR